MAQKFLRSEVINYSKPIARLALFINLVMYKTDSFELTDSLELRLGAPYIAKIRKLWESVRQAFESMPDIEWENTSSDSEEDIYLD